MIPKLIQRQGAQHLAEESLAVPSDGAALNPPRAVLELVPESVCRENIVLPLKLDGRVLHVAAVNASDVMLRDKLSFILNKDIRLVAYPAYEILPAIHRNFGRTESEPVDSLLMSYDGDHDEAPSTVDTMSVFQKLWLMPDQMYHDVGDVRTADDAVLTIKLMMFFELIDIERMLEATHDPIGDFINAATSDVVDFCGRHTFEEFKKNTGDLNELATDRQLTVRATQNGYRINKVVYRGYGAPDRLQAMHDQAIEARTKLQLERATEEQAQGLEDYKLKAQMNRATSRRTEQSIEVQTEIELAQKRQEAEMRTKEAERNAAREQRRRDAETEQEIRRQSDERTRQHLAVLKEMGVDLTAFLTQGRADRVIELRGKGVSPHLHLDNADGEKNG